MCFVCASSAYTGAGANLGHIDYKGYSHSLRDLSKETALQVHYNNLAVEKSVQALDYDVPQSMIDTLVHVWRWNDSPGQEVTLTYSFTGWVYNPDRVLSNNARSFNASQQLAVENIFKLLSQQFDINFVRATNDAQAQIHFYSGDLLNSNWAGVASYGVVNPLSNRLEKVGIGIDSDYTSTQLGTHAYMTLLHEIGHALGLKHPGNYSDGDIEPYLDAGWDTRDTTVMSYNASRFMPSWYQWLDLAAFEYLYTNAGDEPPPPTDPNAPLTLGGGNETYTISGGAAIVFGGLGSDTIYGGTEGDTIYGGRSQADTLDIGDLIYGMQGSDLIFGNGGNDSLYGGLDNDTIYGGRGYDWIQGGLGDDYLAGGGGVAHPEDEADTIYGGAGNDSILGNGGDDILYGEAGNDTIFGGLGNDTIDGGQDADSIDGQDGNDSLLGGEGDDTLIGGLGNDTLIGGDGADSLSGGDGADSLSGGDGNDTLFGGDGNDTILGGDGADEMDGGAGNDSLDGGDGDDKLSGQDGNDTLIGGLGNDSLDGGNGNDSLDGGSGNDTLVGGDGADTLLGGSGDDSIDGGDGDDIIDGGTGNDTLTGGSGRDVFIFRANAGENEITDFNVDADVVRIIGVAGINNVAAALAALTVTDGTTELDLGGGNKVIFTDVPVLAGLHFQFE